MTHRGRPLPGFHDTRPSWTGKNSDHVLTRTLRPPSTTARTFSAWYALAGATVALAGVGWYLAKTVPSWHSAATPASMGQPAPVPSPAIPEALVSPAEPAASVLMPPSASSAAASDLARERSPKPSIDIMNLPPAVPDRAGPGGHSKPSGRAQGRARAGND